jgi:hypothetical protein
LRLVKGLQKFDGAQKMIDEIDKHDELVAERQVRAEFGNVSAMTVYRWDNDERMKKLGWPPALRIQNRKFRSRRAIEIFKQKLQRQAIATAKAKPRGAAK